MDYEAHNDAYSYDENYTESSSEFMVAPSYVDGDTALSYAQTSIMSTIIKKLKSRNKIWTKKYIGQKQLLNK